jgi:hypothetical protein
MRYKDICNKKDYFDFIFSSINLFGKFIVTTFVADYTKTH